MKVYKFYYCGEIPDFILEFGLKYDFGQVLNVTDEFDDLDSNKRVYLYAVTNSKKMTKKFTAERDMDKFIAITSDIEDEDYEKFKSNTNGIYELTSRKVTIRSSREKIYENLILTGFEEYFIDDPNLVLRNYARNKYGLKMMDFLASSKIVDSYFRKCINDIGMLSMVTELKNEEDGHDDLPFSSYEANPYRIYRYFFGFMYKNGMGESI